MEGDLIAAVVSPLLWEMGIQVVTGDGDPTLLLPLQKSVLALVVIRIQTLSLADEASSFTSLPPEADAHSEHHAVTQTLSGVVASVAAFTWNPKGNDWLCPRGPHHLCRLRH